MQMVMKTDNTIRVITMSFTVLQDDIFFIRLKRNHLVALSLFSTIRGTKLKVKTSATTLAKITFQQINCNVKEAL